MTRQQTTKQRIGAGWILICALVALCSFNTAGCQGPLEADKKADAAKDEATKKKDRPKPQFETFKVFTEPNEKSFTDPKLKDTGRVMQAIKPGHWANILVETKANNFDFTGELVSTPLDSQQRPIVLDRSSFCLATERAVALPKGQRKTMESLFFPARSGHMSTQISNRLQSVQKVEQSPAFGDTLTHMPSYQYFMVVLARDPNRYRFLKTLDSVRPLSADMPINPEEAAFYRLVLPATEYQLALPSEPLCWTSVAHVLWDDIEPTVLSSDQQQALLDWLHWGGSLIISGPSSLDALRATFLEPYLPAMSVANKSLDAPALAELDERWTLTAIDGSRIGLPSIEPWPGIELVASPQGQLIAGTGGLVAERRVGRGRIVATAFRLHEPALRSWPSFDSFFNGCILRRPRRTFDAALEHYEFTSGDQWLDPSLVSGVRYLTRDAVNPHPDSSDAEFGDDTLAQIGRMLATVSAGRQRRLWSPPRDSSGTPINPQLDKSDIYKTQSGVAAWNDFSWISSAARQTLRDAAGISVPNRQFVVWTLGIYLIVIVPCNWLLFRVLGRVEWAWLAVPAIAAGWGVAVVYLAQLDIGFARAENEVDVLELQQGFPRGHLTRYSALYSSLSTSYDVRFDDRSALVQPFSTDVDLLRDQTVSTVVLRGGAERQLAGFPVASNATGMVHSEQTVSAGRGIAWHATSEGKFLLENNTPWALAGAVVLSRSAGDDDSSTGGQWAWLGDLPRGAKVDVPLSAHNRMALKTHREQSPWTAQWRPEGALSLTRLLNCVEDIEALQPGELRLVAWREGGLEGVHVDPAAAQARRVTLVVANLAFAPLESPRPDMNLRGAARFEPPPLGNVELQPPGEAASNTETTP